MKQNERLLVYVVTGFLALILVVAVVFSREPGASNAATGKAQSLDQLFGDDAAGDGKGGDKVAKERADGNQTGLPSPGEVAPASLSATPTKSLLAADLVAQQLGASRREHSVRMVRVKQGDSLEGLVRRWCGARDPYLEETKALNETLVVLKAGNEIAVPWVEDDVLLAAIEAQKPKLLAAQDAVANGANGAAPSNASTNASPSFAQPGGKPEAADKSGSDKAATDKAASDRPSTTKPPLATATYTVKDGDNLWRIAERAYGRKNADRMVKAIKEANAGLSDTVRAGQKLVMPARSD